MSGAFVADARLFQQVHALNHSRRAEVDQRLHRVLDLVREQDIMRRFRVQVDSVTNLLH